jgi:hypothetical protein
LWARTNPVSGQLNDWAWSVSGFQITFAGFYNYGGYNWSDFNGTFVLNSYSGDPETLEIYVDVPAMGTFVAITTAAFSPTFIIVGFGTAASPGMDQPFPFYDVPPDYWRGPWQPVTPGALAPFDGVTSSQLVPIDPFFAPPTELEADVPQIMLAPSVAFADALTTVFEGCLLRLFQDSDLELTDDMTVDDFSEANFGGYVPVSLGGLGLPATVEPTGAYVSFSPVTYTASSEVDGSLVNGWFATYDNRDTGETEVWAAAFLPGGPFDMSQIGAMLLVQAGFGLGPLVFSGGKIKRRTP